MQFYTGACNWSNALLWSWFGALAKVITWSNSAREHGIVFCAMAIGPCLDLELEPTFILGPPAQ